MSIANSAQIIAQFRQLYPGVDYAYLYKGTITSARNSKLGPMAPAGTPFNAVILASMVVNGHVKPDGTVDFHELNPLIKDIATIKPVKIDIHNELQIQQAMLATLILPQLIKDRWLFYNPIREGFDLDLSGAKALDHASVTTGELMGGYGPIPVWGPSTADMNWGFLSSSWQVSVIVSDWVLLWSVGPFSQALNIPDSQLSVIQGFTRNVSGAQYSSNMYSQGFMIVFDAALVAVVFIPIPAPTEAVPEAVTSTVPEAVAAEGSELSEEALALESSALPDEAAEAAVNIPEDLAEGATVEAPSLGSQILTAGKAALATGTALSTAKSLAVQAGLIKPNAAPPPAVKPIPAAQPVIASGDHTGLIAGGLGVGILALLAIKNS